MSTCLIEKPTKVYFIIFSLTKILITSTFFFEGSPQHNITSTYYYWSIGIAEEK